ncbi:MAG: hypothetical protein V1918_03625 [Planctomycetota bacterium]
MKFIKIAFGALAAVYAVSQAIYLVRIVMQGTQSMYLTYHITGAAMGVLLGAALSIILFKSAFPKKNEGDRK